MTIGQSIILGIVQGLTEFLPVSSSGHLLLLQELFGIQQPGILAEVVLHLGTLCAVLIYYRRDILVILKKPTPILWYLVLATIPAVIAALLLGDRIDAIFSGVGFLPFAFLITTALLVLGETASHIYQRRRKQHERPDAIDAAVMGIMQAVAIVPGVSRSGSTVTGGLFRGLTRAEAARFSFLMSIPAILGSLVLELRTLLTGGAAGVPWLALALGAIAAAVSGFFAIAFMLRIINRFGLKPFAAYTAVLGVVLLFVL